MSPAAAGSVIETCTRVQMVAFLWNAAGKPEPAGPAGFSDVSADSYYAKAVAWAVENGVTSGTGNGKFSPDAECTRAQAVTLLYNFKGGVPAATESVFTDVSSDAYYCVPVLWAYENKITAGTGASTFSPDNFSTRAQIVTFLYRIYGQN